jgi:hypothetical protein
MKCRLLTAILVVFTYHVAEARVSGFESRCLNSKGIKNCSATFLLTGLETENDHHSVNTVSAMPVTIVSFTVEINKDNQAEIKWTTASENSLIHFIVEKSTDGVNFLTVEKVMAAGSSGGLTNYKLLDNIHRNGSSSVYYRLRSVDQGGRIYLSSIRFLQIDEYTDNNIAIITYPNPVKNELRVTIPSKWLNIKVTYELFNGNGQVIKKTETINNKQAEALDVNSLAPGCYIIRVSCNGETAQQKIIKQ